MRRLIVTSSLALLAACGFNGTDPDEANRHAAAEQAPAKPAPEFAEADQEIPDSEPRPQMQLSVDTLEDLQRVEAILARLGEPTAGHGLDAVIAAADAIERVGVR